MITFKVAVPPPFNVSTREAVSSKLRFAFSFETGSTHKNFIRFFGAHFRRQAPETGLSAPIPQPLRGFRYFRFNPLRALYGSLWGFEIFTVWKNPLKAQRLPTVSQSK
jgi:hypothetical protein